MEDMMPPRAVHVLMFMQASDERGIAADSIAQYVTGIRSMALELGYSADGLKDPRVQRMKRSLKKRDRKPKRRRLPITVAILRDVVLAARAVRSHEQVMLWGAMSLGIHGLFRAGEIVRGSGKKTTLTWSDCEISSNGAQIRVFLKTSKSDLRSRGVWVTIKATGSSVCPVSYMLMVSRYCAKSGVEREECPVFHHPDGKPWTYKELHAGIRGAVQALGFNSKEYGSHSLRIGGATTLALQGVQAHVIKSKGRWKSLAYQLYVRDNGEHEESVAKAFGRAATTDSSSPLDAFGGLSIKSATSMSGGSLEVLFKENS